MPSRNTAYPWFDGTALDAAVFHAEAIAAPDPAAARCAFEAMMGMTRIDIAKIEATRRG